MHIVCILCFFRCISIAAYGCQNLHDEMRVRINYELVTNILDYVNNDNLNRGLAQYDEHLLSKFLAYSSDVASRINIEAQMQGVIMSAIKDGDYCCVFQVMAAANVLKRPVALVYPTYGGATVHGDLNRIFLPRVQTIDEPIHVFFTSTEGIMQEEINFRVNHFCLLLPPTTLCW